ncbi:MAG TPA: OsmC family protein [bacterium]|nr:OsmC family protein [bacterium]
MTEPQTKSGTINGVDTHSLKKTVGSIQRNPELGRCEFRLRNEWVTGDQNRSQVHDFYAAGGEQKHKKAFQFQAGEPELIAGRDEGANPVEFLLSGLSGCMTTTIAYYAALNGHTIKKMESEYKGDLDMRGLFNLDPNVRPGYQKIRVNFRIQTDAPKEEIAKYYPFSPVYDVVSKSVPIEVNVETY